MGGRKEKGEEEEDEMDGVPARKQRHPDSLCPYVTRCEQKHVHVSGCCAWRGVHVCLRFLVSCAGARGFERRGGGDRWKERL